MRLLRYRNSSLKPWFSFQITRVWIYLRIGRREWVLKR
jgi:hypothetical protein